MALGTGLSGTGGSHDLYVPEVWTKRILSAFEKNTVAKDLCLDLSEYLNYQGGDIIRVPKLANRTAITRALTAFTEIVPGAATESQFSMNVQTWVTDDEFISDALSAQTKLFQMDQVDHKMQRSIAEKFDTDLLANSTSLTATVGTDNAATPLSASDIFDALAALDNNFVPRSDRTIVLSPKTYWGLVKDNQISSMDFMPEGAKYTGKIMQLGGYPVVMSQNLPTTAAGSKINLVLHKEALAFAIAKQPSVMNEHYAARRGTIVGGDMIYGTGCYRAEAGVQMFGV